MEMFDMNVTNGSNSTATLGPSVVELIVFAALSWTVIVFIVIFTAMVRYLIADNHNEVFRCFWTVMVIAVTAAAVTAAVLVVVGSVLSTQNGNSTGLSGEGVAGRVLLILTEVITLLVWALFIAVIVYDFFYADDKSGRAVCAVLGIVSGTLFVGVALLGWSSFQFDTIQGNGSNSTGTPGLRIAGVVFSSVGVGIPILLFILISCVLCSACLKTAMMWLTVPRKNIQHMIRDTQHSVYNELEMSTYPCYIAPQTPAETEDATFSGFTEDATFSGFTEGATFSGFTEDATCSGFTEDATFSGFTEDATFSGFTEDATFSGFTDDARLRKSKSLLEEALKHGFVECRTVVCLLVGVAGAGKTHTKHLLFRWAPPEVRESTSLATKPVRAIRISTLDGQLQEVDPDQLDQIIADTVAKGGVLLEKRRFIQTLRRLFCCKHNNQTTSTGMSAGISPPSSSHGTTTSLSSQSTTNNDKCCCCPIAHSRAEQTAKAALDKTTRQIATTSEPQQLLDCDWIYLIDSGGQIEFLEALPAFLQHTSVCLFVTKLSEKLSERPKIEYFEDGKLVGEPTLCPFTNEQMLMRCVQTIQTQCIDQVGNTNKASQQSKQDNQGSKLVMVGTHQDLQGQCSESTEEKNHLLQNKLCPEFDNSLVFHGQGIIFPINAKNPGPQDHKVASEITKVIFDLVSHLEPRKTPISWFKFEQLMQKMAGEDGKRILHWKECLKVAKLLHLSVKDLRAALDHLASFGVIHYYRHLLPNIVFVDPQILLSKISELVKHHYKLRHDPEPQTAIGGEWRKFTNEGCITLELLKQFPEHYTDFFTADDFLSIMKDRLIVSYLIGKDEYFMPCLLKTLESQEIDQYRVSASGVAPLAIHFSCKLVPHGVFCSLVAFLRSSLNSSCWSLFPHPENTTEPQCLTRNCIKFKSPKCAPGSLTLIDAFSHFEVHVNTQHHHDICVHLCPSIWDTLSEGIHKAAETLKYDLVPKQAFLCKHDNTRPHLALLAEEPLNCWTCELNPDISGPLKEEHKVWLPTEELQASVNGGLTEPTQSVQHDLSGAKVKSKLDSPEYQAFQKHFAVLNDGIIDPNWLAAQLFSKDMISRNMRREAELETTPVPTRTHKLLSAVEAQILTSPEPKFGDFLYILHSESALDHLARKLEETCRAATKGAQPKPVCQDQSLQEPEEQVQPTVMKTDYGVDGGPATEAAQLNRVSQYQRLQEPKEEVHIPLETHSEVNEGAQTLKEVRITMETLSREMPAPNAEVQTILEVHSEFDEGLQEPMKKVHTQLETHSEVNEEVQAPTAEVQALLEVHPEQNKDCPTVLECTRFQGRERTINIPQDIGPNYYYFGLYLLDDHNGTRVKNIEHKQNRDAERINTEILQEWAMGKGKKPVTWKTLTEVLRDIELCALASEIEEVKLNPTLSTKL